MTAPIHGSWERRERATIRSDRPPCSACRALRLNSVTQAHNGFLTELVPQIAVFVRSGAVMLLPASATWTQQSPTRALSNRTD